MAKTKIYIDEYHDESGFTFYRVLESGTDQWPTRLCSSGGFFLYEEDLLEWLDDYGKSITVVKDYRSQDELKTDLL